MKMKLLLATGLSIALALTKSYAGDPETESGKNDTLIFSPITDSKVLIIGPDMSLFADYTKLDSVKSLFLSDMKKSQEQNSYPAGSKVTHYFVHPNGKRRIKAESTDFLQQGINVEEERKSLSLKLFPYSYILHDLESDIYCTIFLKEPSQLPSLETISFNDALRSLSADKKAARKHYRIDLEKEGSEWKHKSEFASHQDFLELTPSFGLGIIGGAWSPVLGAHLSLTFNNKYGLPKYKLSGSLNGYLFADYFNKTFSNFYPVHNYQLGFMFNFAPAKTSKANWFGLQGGYFQSRESGSLNGAYKVGIMCEGFSVFNYSVDLIRDKQKNNLMGITLRFPF